MKNMLMVLPAVTAVLGLVMTKAYGGPKVLSACIHSEKTPLLIRKTPDFELTGTDSARWQTAEWHAMTKLDDGGENYQNKFKILYSVRGIYVLFSGSDKQLSTTYDTDFGELWKGDVFEVFFHPNPGNLPPPEKALDTLSYLEYEVNPLDKELVLLIHHAVGKTEAQFPKAYEGERQIRKTVCRQSEPKKSAGCVTGWRVELFFPFTLLQDLCAAPHSGTIWNMNFCRIDYDTGNPVKWSWTPSIRDSFHELDKFLSVVFE